MPYADTILKIIQALKPQPPAVAPLSDFLIQHRRYNEFEKAFGSKDMPIDEFAKAAKATFDTPYKPPA
jgi:hypothetical protein